MLHFLNVNVDVFVFVLMCVHRHAAEVIETPGWKNMVHVHPSLIAETFKALVNQHSPTLGPNRKRFKPTSLSASNNNN